MSKLQDLSNHVRLVWGADIIASWGGLLWANCGQLLCADPLQQPPAASRARNGVQKLGQGDGLQDIVRV